MKLSSLIRERKQPKKKPGTYAGVRLSKKSNDIIMDAIAKMDVPTPVRPTQIHMTLLYSRKHLPEYKAPGKLETPMKATAKGLKIFHPQEDESHNILVLTVDCPELSKRHAFLKKEHGATDDYPSYIPHITLSYACGDFDIKEHDITKMVGDLEIVEEYQEELNDGDYE